MIQKNKKSQEKKTKKKKYNTKLIIIICPIKHFVNGKQKPHKKNNMCKNYSPLFPPNLFFKNS
jgi:hypothetical protein